MRTAFIIVLTALGLCAVATSQVAPAATSSNATLVYDLSYSQNSQFYSDTRQALHRGVASGEVQYLSGNEHLPLILTYSGGDMFALGGSRSGTGVFQHLLLSQGYVQRAWSLTVSDDLSYMPQSPTTGFSGIPGIGALPASPGPPTQPILLENTRSVNNDLEADYTHFLASDKTFGVHGGYGVMRFPDGYGLDINQIQATPQLTWRINPLNTADVQFAFSRFTYAGTDFSMGTQSVQFGLSRTWNRHLKTVASAGPEWINSSTHSIVPSSTGLAVNFALDYQARSVSYALSYYRATTAGVGTATQLGIRNDDMSASVTRPFGKDLTVSATCSYLRSQAILQGGATNGKYGGVQLYERLGRDIVLFANYAFIQQTSSLTLSPNAVNGLSQVIGFGVGYSPRHIHISKR